MDTRIIEYIITIAEEKSLSRAAEKLYITQPALSQRVKKLEQELGCPLFVRTRDGLSLTDAGRIYVNGGHSVLKYKEEAMEKLRSLQRGQNDVLRYACATSIAFESVPDFRARYPEITLKSVHCSSPQAIEALMLGHMDLAVLLSSSPTHEALEYIPLSQGSLRLAIPNGPNCTRQDSIERKDYSVLSEDYFILSTIGSYARELEEHALHLMNLQPAILCEISDNISRRYMLNKGLGNGFLPSYTIQKEDKYHSYLVDDSLFFHVVAAYPKTRSLTEPMKYMLELLLSIFET